MMIRKFLSVQWDEDTKLTPLKIINKIRIWCLTIADGGGNLALEVFVITKMFSCLLFAMLISGQSISAMPKIVFVGIENLEVETLTSADPRYLSTMSGWVSPVAMQQLEPILPYGLVLKNNTNKSIVLIAVRWELQGEDGKPVVHTMRLQTILRDAKHMQMPGESAFMAPKTGLNAKFFPGTSSHLSGGDLGWRSQSLFMRQEKIVVRLDAIAFSDGTVAGADLSKSIPRLNSLLTAELELLQELLSIGDRQDLLQSTLRRHAAWKVSQGAKSVMESTEAVLQEKAHIATRFLSILERSGADEILKVCRATLAAPKIQAFDSQKR